MRSKSKRTRLKGKCADRDKRRYKSAQGRARGGNSKPIKKDRHMNLEDKIKAATAWVFSGAADKMTCGDAAKHITDTWGPEVYDTVRGKYLWVNELEPEPEPAKIDAHWRVELNADCPHCDEHVDVLTAPDFWDDTERSRNVEVHCPSCSKPFSVNCVY